MALQCPQAMSATVTLIGTKPTRDRCRLLEMRSGVKQMCRDEAKIDGF